jgi:hypothetical protein
MSTAFDRALELHELRLAAEAYASRHGEMGSAGYRAAWLRFRQRIQSIHDLQRMRAKATGAKARRDPRISRAERAVRTRHVDVRRTDKTSPRQQARAANSGRKQGVLV